MLVPERISWWRLVFKYRGTELPRTKYRLLSVAVVSTFVTFLEEQHDWHPDLTPLPFQLIGVALGIFLGFQNNAAYDRWWEGRKLWGSLVNTSRSMARQVLTLVGPTEGPEAEEAAALRDVLVRRIIAFAHALRLSLRDDDDLTDLERFLDADEVRRLKSESNRPFAINQGTAERLRAAWKRGWIDTFHLPVLEASMVSMTDVQGACERIKGTPIPFSYKTLIHRITALYCYTFPFGLVDLVHIFTPLVCVIVAYALFGLDAVGDEIEMPFGTDPNDLPLHAISTTIEVNLRQRLGDTDLPPMRKAVGEILD